MEWKFDPARDLALQGEARLQSLQREVGLVGAASCLAWRWLTKLYLAGAHRLEIHGREHLPRHAPFILVANHSSHLDAITLATAVPLRQVGRVFPIAAGDTFFTKPLTSLFATACMNALPIWRKNCGAHSLDDLRARLTEGRCIYILFPEGTRSRTGEMARFKPGLGRLIAGTAAPVVPCYLEGAWDALPPDRSTPAQRRSISASARPCTSPKRPTTAPAGTPSRSKWKPRCGRWRCERNRHPEPRAAPQRHRSTCHPDSRCGRPQRGRMSETSPTAADHADRPH